MPQGDIAIVDKRVDRSSERDQTKAEQAKAEQAKTQQRKRLGEALRANLKRRKAARDGVSDEQRDDPPDGAESPASAPRGD